MNTMEATTVMVILAAVLRVTFKMGRFSHLVLPSFGFVSGSHTEQLVDPISVLMVP